jgi:LysR family transcriptional activator of nhaA
MHVWFEKTKLQAVSELNFHHLRYFWVIAHQRSLTRAAEALHVSASALSIQLRQLEERLGHALFERRNRQLVLTEAGRLVLDHADTIFRTGQELLSTLSGVPVGSRVLLRVGAVATLSRNFQISWLSPLLTQGAVQIRLVSGVQRELLAQLASHSLDVVLSNEAAPRDKTSAWVSRRIAQQPMCIVSRPAAAPPTAPAGFAAPRAAAKRSKRPSPLAPLRFPQDLQGQPLLLPSEQSAVRPAFDRLLDEAGVHPVVLGEIDDMAMLRLLARETGALALVPRVVVRDELASGTLVERCTVPGLQESFYAISTRRRFAHPLLRELLGMAPTAEPAGASPTVRGGAP